MRPLGLGQPGEEEDRPEEEEWAEGGVCWNWSPAAGPWRGPKIRTEYANDMLGRPHFNSNVNHLTSADSSSCAMSGPN